MNVGRLNQTTFNPLLNSAQKKAENSTSIEIEDRQMRHSAAKKDDLVNQFWNITDSMPRENQISFAATVVAGRIMKQGITDENKSFMQNISNRFSPEEIGSIKQQILNHPSVKGQNSGEIEKFLKDFDQLISNQNSSELDPLKKQQANPRLRTPEEIFFQTTFNSNQMNQIPLV
jgi:hypothetical protein